MKSKTNFTQLYFKQFNSNEKEDPLYYSKQLITCIGNKRSLLGAISAAVEHVTNRLGSQKLRILDGFSGSGVVSRMLKSHAKLLISNDIEDYAVAAARSHLENRSKVDFKNLHELVNDLNQKVNLNLFDIGFIEKLYSPKNEESITIQDRVFYTKNNAKRIDDYCRMLETLPDDMSYLLRGPLLSEASIHANTAGVFKGFYKDRHTGVGKFGGTGSDALERILGDIKLAVPILSKFECEIDIRQEDANTLVRKISGLDLAYFDPPYNQHPYGSNYFMLNLLVRYACPSLVSRVSGIPVDWRRSAYNVRSRALPTLNDLVEATDAKFILLSFNNEGFISKESIVKILENIGKVNVFDHQYSAFRGTRDRFKNRAIHVTEYLFLVERN